MKNSLKISLCAVCIFLLGTAMAQHTMANVDAFPEATVSVVKPGEQKKKTRKKTAAAMEIYQIETNQAAEMISRFIRKNITYPASFRENALESEMMVDFFIDRNGVIQNIKIAKGNSELFKNEILKDLKALKDIKIRHYLGASRIRVPVNFSLQ